MRNWPKARFLPSNARSNKPLPAADGDVIVDRKNQRPEKAFYRHVRRF
jgi:hypothetical protein